jgi:CheY-like chemotaxis protein
VINLCVNAADAMPHGGALVLSTYDLVVTDDFRRAHPEASAPRYAVVSVADTGTGIAPDVLPHIFEPFFTTKGVGLGTGLGLAMVYGTVKSHGGWIDVQSELGKGSTFSLYLPSSDVPLGAEKETAPTVEYGTGCILLVDDEEAVLKLGKEILETYGYEVLTAPSGERALEIYREQGDEIDLVVIDMVMPHMNAPELFEHLQKMNPNVQAILCSGYAPDSRVDDLLRRGVREFIPKPYDIAHFVNTANRILKEKNAPRPALRATGRPAPKHR